VVHYWHVEFAGHHNPLLAIIDLRRGGLEFLGGRLGGAGGIALYLLVKKESVRLYLDILAPGLMWGLAIGRIGCFLNGCCFGGPCDLPWGVQFPYGSNPYIWQWENRQIRVPAELINSTSRPVSLLGAAALNMSDDRRRGPKRRVEDIEKQLAAATASDPDSETTRQLQASLASAKRKLEKFKRENWLGVLEKAQLYPSRMNPGRRTSVSELQQLAQNHPSLPVNPTQLYSSIHAFLLAGLLSTVFYRRTRHGVVVGLLFLLYPIARVILESIRVDNPHDTAGLTISQFVSLVMFVGGAAYLYVLYRFMPQRSPRVVAYIPPEETNDK